jgi:hypothetical protein
VHHECRSLHARQVRCSEYDWAFDEVEAWIIDTAMACVTDSARHPSDTHRATSRIALRPEPFEAGIHSKALTNTPCSHQSPGDREHAKRNRSSNDRDAPRITDT